MLARLSLTLLAILLTACGTARTSLPRQIVLLASFEGRYSEIGYDALYAAQLALADSDRPDLQLLPIDDGGTVASAVDRARALAQNDQYVGVVAAGYFAADPHTQAAYADLPVLVVGGWTSLRAADNVFILSHPAIAQELTAAPGISLMDAALIPAPVTGGEVFALRQVPLLREDLPGITILSSALLPTDAFYARYLAVNQFAKPPGLLAMLTYDAVHLLATSTRSDRAADVETIANAEYAGLNGAIRFENGFWVDAPIHRYTYTNDGRLITSDDAVE